MNLKISEVFYSIQGEGKTIGTPSVFISLKGCNLLCKGDWECDAIDVWKNGNELKKNEFSTIMKKYIHKLEEGSHLIFSGGEPLMQQQEIIEAINDFKLVYNFKPFIEIETNGTIMPTHDLIGLVDLFNCSFKLNNSGIDYDDRIKIDVLKKLNSLDTIFKIVIYPVEDYDEAEIIFNAVNIDKKNIYLMPPANSFSELSRRSQHVASICIDKGVNFTTRLQLILYNKTSGFGIDI